MSDGSSLICGFWDPEVGLAGVAWRLGSAGGLLWRDGKLSPASAEIDDSGDSLNLRLQAGADACDVELSPRAGEVALSGGAAAVACQAAIGAGGNGRATAASGQVTRWPSDPTDGTGLLRHLAVPGANGAVLLLLSTGAAGVHTNEEATASWLLDPEGGVTPFAESLLSTQYDGDGLQSRAGLELWTEDEEAGPVRAAGTRLGDAPQAQDGVAAALLRSSADGIVGLGSYLIWRG